MSAGLAALRVAVGLLEGADPGPEVRDWAWAMIGACAAPPDALCTLAGDWDARLPDEKRLLLAEALADLGVPPGLDAAPEARAALAADLHAIAALEEKGTGWRSVGAAAPRVTQAEKAPWLWELYVLRIEAAEPSDLSWTLSPDEVAAREAENAPGIEAHLAAWLDAARLRRRDWLGWAGGLAG